MQKFFKLSQYEVNKEFINACENGYIDIVQYLLTSSELKTHADIHAGYDSGFKKACGSGYLDIIQYLIFDMNLEKTESINYYLLRKPNEEVAKLFNIRELNEKLIIDLSFDKPNTIKKKKI